MVDPLGPGSSSPSEPSQVEALLQCVPEIAYAPELSALLPAPLGTSPLSANSVALAVDDDWRTRLVGALNTLQARAELQSDGGLRFLAITLRHFVTEEQIPMAEHPLVVALFARTAAQRDHTPDRPPDIARVLDRWR